MLIYFVTHLLKCIYQHLHRYSCKVCLCKVTWLSSNAKNVIQLFLKLPTEKYNIVKNIDCGILDIRISPYFCSCMNEIDYFYDISKQNKLVLAVGNKL